MVFIALFAIAATAASAYAAAEQAKADDEFNALTVDINNKEAMANYRRNLIKFGEVRIEKRKTVLNLQANLSSQYQTALKDFQGSYQENWGQSAHLFAQQLARKAGEDREQLNQNLGRELERINAAQEESRLDLRTQFKAVGAETANRVLLQGIIATGKSAATEIADAVARGA